MKIATYNINGINGRLENLLRWLQEADPAIVCLQELKSENHKFPERALKDAGYNAIWQGQKSWNGVAILAKSEIKELRNDLPGEDEEFTHSRYIEAFVMASWSVAFTCPTAILGPARNSITNCAGSKGLQNMQKTWSTGTCPSS
jgi:exonuclease III